MIQIRKFKQEDKRHVLNIQLIKEQNIFTETPKDFISDTDGNITRFVICFDNSIVGYFKIDSAFNLEILGENKGVGLRSFAIDCRHQGKGIGKTSVSLLADAISTEFPDFNWVYLTVNCRNKAACQTYLKGGFEDTGTLYHGGPVGPQHIMRKAL